jgi:hypothetical protein
LIHDLSRFSAHPNPELGPDEAARSEDLDLRHSRGSGNAGPVDAPRPFWMLLASALLPNVMAETLHPAHPIHRKGLLCSIQEA